MLNPDVRKTILRDNNGITLLPRTTASMVSEEPDRRFIDNTEKGVLNVLTDKAPALSDLADLVNEIRLMADHIDELVNLLDGRETLQEIGENGELFTSLIPLIPELNNLLHGVAQVRSTSTSILYRLDVDDTDPENPKLNLIPVDETPVSEGEEEPLLSPNGDEDLVEGDNLEELDTHGDLNYEGDDEYKLD